MTITPLDSQLEKFPGGFPKLVVLARAPFNRQDGTGIGLASFFHGWPKDRIVQLCGQGGQIAPDYDVCENYYRLGAAELRRTFPLALYDRLRSQTGQSSASNNNKIRFGSNAPKSGRGLRQSKIVSKLQRALHDHGLLYPIDSRLSSELKDYLEKFEPELIFSLPAEFSFVRLTRQIGEYFKIPVAMLQADNWMPLHYKKGFLAKQKRSRLDHEMRAMFDMAALRFGISDRMCDVFESEYGQPFTPLPVSVDVALWHRPLGHRKQTSGSRVIVYAGTIHQHAAYTGLADMSRTVEALNHAGVGVKFLIVSPEEASEKQVADLGGEFTNFVHEPDRKNLINRVGSADLLFLPTAFEAEGRQFAKYSLPAKSAAYMASGTPTIVYAPADFPISIEARRHNFAHVVNKRDINQLTRSVRHMLEDTQLRASISKSAGRCAKENYDIEVVSLKVRRKFCEEILRNRAESQHGAALEYKQES